ncbi:MAG TPA: hypothetical protein VL463_17795 [Kofleriaceae bacterium]|nr:hypothetical protein [Kofleriaceae bacterium]
MQGRTLYANNGTLGATTITEGAGVGAGAGRWCHTPHAIAINKNKRMRTSVARRPRGAVSVA